MPRVADLLDRDCNWAAGYSDLGSFCEIQDENYYGWKLETVNTGLAMETLDALESYEDLMLRIGYYLGRKPDVAAQSYVAESMFECLVATMNVVEAE